MQRLIQKQVRNLKKPNSKQHIMYFAPLGVTRRALALLQSFCQCPSNKSLFETFSEKQFISSKFPTRRFPPKVPV